MYAATALSIAGSDSGGGAGIQADLAAFAWFKVFGTTALTAVTAQNPRGVTAIQAIDPAVVTAQIDAVFAAFPVAAVKTGMLFNAEIITAVAAALQRWRPTHVVVDPVMVATSGARLLREDAMEALRSRLLPAATLLTPNLPEAEILTGRPLETRAAAAAAARQLAATYGGAVLLKGGHAAAERASDYLADGGRVWEFSAPRVEAPTTHGTGCSLSAALAACLAQGAGLVPAVVQAKAYVLARLRRCAPVGPGVWAMAPPDRLPVEAVEVRESDAYSGG